MIELTCPKCNTTFERRGYPRGQRPQCNSCQDQDEFDRLHKRGKYAPVKYSKRS